MTFAHESLPCVADGEVLYTMTKPNPRYSPGASYTALDRTESGAEQKVYV